MGSRTTSRSNKPESTATPAKPAARAARKPAPASAEKAARPRARRPATVSPEERLRYIAEAAYYIAERRGFAGGGPLDDWLQAEAQIEHLLDTETTH